jgi:hypothetical protein
MFAALLFGAAPRNLGLFAAVQHESFLSQGRLLNQAKLVQCTKV